MFRLILFRRIFGDKKLDLFQIEQCLFCSVIRFCFCLIEGSLYRQRCPSYPAMALSCCPVLVTAGGLIAKEKPTASKTAMQNMAKGLLKKPPPFVSIRKLYSKKIRDLHGIYTLKIQL